MICDIPVEVLEYIRATSSFGGDLYPDYQEGYSPANASAFELWVDGQPKAKGITLYRGYTFEEGYWRDGCVDEGACIGPDQMTASLDLPAFTESEVMAARYICDYGNGIGDTDVRVLFEIRTTGKTFVDISPYSLYPQETEYRCTRNMQVRVDSITHKGGYLHIVCTEL